MTNVGYRAFPPTLSPPSHARRFSATEFQALTKSMLESAPSCCDGHRQTNIWYVESLGYIVEVVFDHHVPAYAFSICTFTPTHGMDRIDGEFAQDVEAQMLKQTLGIESGRLDIFAPGVEIPVEQYLRDRGILS